MELAGPQERCGAACGAWIDSEKAKLLEKAILLQRGGVDRSERRAIRKVFRREQKADQRIPPGSVIQVYNRRQTPEVR
jgi:hypothetical protein